MNFVMKTVPVAVGTALLAGCNTELTREVEQKAQADIASTSKLLNRSNTLVESPVIRVTNGVFIGGKKIKADNKSDVPYRFNSPFSIAFKDKSIFYVLERIYQEAGIRVDVDDTAKRYLTSAAESGSGDVSAGLASLNTSNEGNSSSSSLFNSFAMEATPTSAVKPAVPHATSSTAASTPASASAPVVNSEPQMSGADILQNSLKFSVSYEGTVRDFFDYLTSKMGLSWRFKNDRIEIYWMDTRSYVVDALVGNSTFSANMTNSSSSGGGSDMSSTQSTSNSINMGVNSNTEVWASILKTVKSIAASDGNKMVTVEETPALGMFTVTATPQVLSKIEDYVKEVNVLAGKKIMIKAEVLEVNTNRDSEFGIDWNIVFNKASTLGLAAASQAEVINPGIVGTVLRPTSDLANSQVMAKALQTQGDVSLRTSATLVTVNGQPTPLQVATETSYLAETSVTVTADTTTAEMTPDTISDGFTINLLPRLMNEGGLLMQYSMDMRTLESMDEISAHGSTVQLPKVNTQNFLQRVTVKPGETLLIAGFDREIANSQWKGPFGPMAAFLGGSRTASKSKKVTVILLTPYVMD